jgi:hypothetical protein
MKKAILLFAALLAAVPAYSQNPTVLSQFFEGKQVTIRMDMPASQTGIDLYPGRATPIDLNSYSGRLKNFGVSIRNGDTVMITKIKVKDKNIEFQLAGGGYGTFWDDTNTTVTPGYTEKSQREKDIEDRLKWEDDYYTRRQLQRELDYLRGQRDRQDARNQAMAEQASEMKKVRVDAKRIQGGSRFNIWYSNRVPADLTPQQLMQELAQYVEFPQQSFPGSLTTADVSDPEIHGSPNPVTHLKKGLTQEQVVDLLGPAIRTTQNHENGMEMTSSSFRYQDSTVDTSFVNGVLVKYSVSVH